MIRFLEVEQKESRKLRCFQQVEHCVLNEHVLCDEIEGVPSTGSFSDWFSYFSFCRWFWLVTPCWFRTRLFFVEQLNRSRLRTSCFSVSKVVLLCDATHAWKKFQFNLFQITEHVARSSIAKILVPASISPIVWEAPKGEVSLGAPNVPSLSMRSIESFKPFIFFSAGVCASYLLKARKSSIAIVVFVPTSPAALFLPKTSTIQQLQLGHRLRQEIVLQHASSEQWAKIFQEFKYFSYRLIVLHIWNLIGKLVW